MTNRDFILKITAKDKEERLRKIESCIEVDYEVQVAEEDGLCDSLTNIIIPARNQEGKISVIAHHDVLPGTSGYNDNSTGVVTLLKLQKHLPDHVELVFTDGEERGGSGCRLYLDNRPQPIAAINVDVVGLKGKIFYEEYGNKRGIFKIPKSLEYYNYIPFSDSYVLAQRGVPNILLLTGGSQDTLIREIFDSQHGGKNDGRLDLVSESMMDRVFEVVLSIVKSGLHM